MIQLFSLLLLFLTSLLYFPTGYFCLALSFTWLNMFCNDWQQFLILIYVSYFLLILSCSYDLWRNSWDIASMYCEMIQNDFIFSKFYKLLLSQINAFRYYKIWRIPDSCTAHFWLFLINHVLIHLFISSYACGITKSYFYGFK